jgi:hypothetical protein
MNDKDSMVDSAYIRSMGMSEDDFDEFGFYCQLYIMNLWEIIEKEFNEAIEDACGDEESGYYIIINTPLWLFMAMIIKDTMQFASAKKFFEKFKPKKNRRKFYKFLKSKELHDALMNLGKNTETY